MTHRSQPVRRSLRTVLTWAAASCAVALSLTLPTNLQATDAAEKSARPAIARPTFAGEGFEVTARWSKGEVPAKGAALNLEVVAVNRTDATMEIRPVIQFMSRERASNMSRVMPMHKEIHRQELTITLAPGERKTIAVETAVRAPDAAELFVNVGDGTRFVTAITFAPKA